MTLTPEPRLQDTLPVLPPRRADSHKGTYGRVLIAAGSRFMPGAAALSARSAYRSGAGLVTVLTDAAQIPAVSLSVVEAVFSDWTAMGASLAGDGSLDHDAYLVGPGLGLPDRGRLVIDLIRSARAPVVIDADALNIIARDAPVLPRREDRIWTPHPGEFHRLTGLSPRSEEERFESAKTFVHHFGGVVILKGHRSVVMNRDRYAINQTGNAGMATAGSGDVLGGVLVALLGQGLEPFDAARLACHIHGSAGDLAAAALGQISLTAGDIIEYLPAAFCEHARTAPGAEPPGSEGREEEEGASTARREGATQGEKR